MTIPRLTILIMTLAGIFAVPAKAQINYLRLFLFGSATPAGWSVDLPEEMVAIGNNCFLWDGWLGEGELKFFNTRGDWDSMIVTTSPGIVFEEGQQYGLLYRHSEDNKFVNNKPGFVRIIVDLGNMKVNFRRPALALTGAAVKGWSLTDIIPIFADDEGRVSWSGQLRSGELKILADGAFDWTPCYNAPVEGDSFGPGGHQMVYNTSAYDADGNFVDFKYVVPKAGLYTLTFKNENGGRFFGVDVATATEPDLTGGFRSRPGRYLAAVDRSARRVHFGPVPTRLYIGVSSSDYAEIKSDGEGRFSSVVRLNKGQYYKLSSDPSRWEATAISPNTDTYLTPAATSNMAPIHGYSYVVEEDGNYRVSADFTGNQPSIAAVKQVVSSEESVAGKDPVVDIRVIAGSIMVEGEYSSVEVYDVSGRLAGRTSPCRVSPGIYIVKVDNKTFKVSAL